LVRVSRPLLWLNTAALWALALLVLDRFPGWQDLLMIGYFTLPFNLWLHGINDIYDYESDLRNARKGSDEGALLPARKHHALASSLLLWNVPFWLLALWQGTPLALALLALFLFLGWAYSAPPVRGKSRPFLDGMINTGYVLPFLIALAWHGAPAALWLASLPGILAFAAWCVASHAFTSIQDIEPDRAGGIHTVATCLGPRYSAWFALGFYGLAVLGAAWYGPLWAALVALYPLLVVAFQRQPDQERAHRLYRWFILFNSLLGLSVTVALVLNRPQNLPWVLLLMPALVALVALARAWGRYEAPERLMCERELPRVAEREL
jgi:4-hydroxybenzoate polyprenyltransferase